jgi:hypothetical protein
MIGVTAAERSLRATALTCATSDTLEQNVAGGVAEGIVDELETIQIDEHHTELAIVALRNIDGSVEHLAEHRPIGQVGEIIVGRQVVGPYLGTPALILTVKILKGERDVLGHAR